MWRLVDIATRVRDFRLSSWSCVFAVNSELAVTYFSRGINFFCQHHHHLHHTSHKITWSIKQHSANCKEEDVWLRGSVRVGLSKEERALSGVRRAGWVWRSALSGSRKGCEVRGGMVGDKTTSANSMGHFSKGTPWALSVCLSWPREANREGIL